MNGNKIGTCSYNGSGQINGTFVLANNSKIYKNDVRIYDHCLSAAEVHEISQGLVLHYKLDGFNNASMLPSQYQQLEYIESSGTSYFDTGYKFNIETDSCKVIFKSNNTSHNGMILANSTKPYFWFYYYGSNGIRVYADNGNGQQGINGGNNNLNDHTMEFKNKTYYLDGANKGTLSNTYSDTSNNLWLFSYGGSSYPFQGRIYYTEIKKNNDYQRIFIPAKRLTDSVAGMYDLITNTFYVSSNAAFTAGMAVGTLTIQDSSGYGHNGTIVGTPTITSNTARHSASIYLADGTASRITTPQLSFEPHAITLNIWFRSTNTSPTGTYHMVVDSNAHRQWYEMAVYQTGYFRGGLFINGARKADNGTSTKCLDGKWHMLTLSYDGTNVNRYVDGIMEKATAAAFSTGLSTPTALTIGRDGPNASYAVKEASISDFRIYCTALSADDILSLYHTAAKVDNLGGLHTFEFQEKGPNKIYKTGITQGQEISEINGMSNLKYDPNVYIEPDGSAWVRIFHHVNPTSNKFASSDTFTTGVYKDENRWFNFDLCNYTDKWEFIAAVTRTNTDTLERYRWIQSANPLNATFDQTKVANVTRITTGYNTSPLGGLYHVSGSSWLAANNGTNNNWFGATGCWTAWNGGIPGWRSTNSGDAITTGTIDIYLRIDNITTTMPTIAKSTKNNIWVGHTLIER